jgi:hypothetical protein
MSPQPQSSSLRTRAAGGVFLAMLLFIGVPLAALLLAGPPSPNAPLIASVFGFAMTCFLFGAHYGRSRKIARNFGFELSVYEVPHEVQTMEIVVEAAPAVAKDMAIRALRYLNREVDIEPAEGTVRAVTPMARGSLGERIEVAIDPIGLSRSRLRLSSRGRLWTKYVDSGTNLENVARLSEFLRDFDVRGEPP